MKAAWVIVPIGAALGAAGLLAANVKEQVHPAVPPTGLEVHQTHAAGSLLGQFRTSASSWLWLRTDLYLHNGVEMRPLTEQELQAGQKGVGGAKDGSEAIMNDDRIVTVVPDEKADFRGLFGQLERAVSAYKPMEGHHHNDPSQSLPLFRLMTWLDPQFVLAWVTGATIIARDRSEKGTAKALAFLEEGEANNRTSVAIPTEKARLLATRRKDLAAAKPLLETAVERGGDNPQRLFEIERDALNLAARLLAIVYRDLGEVEAMNHHLRRSERLFPKDPMFQRLREAAAAKSSAAQLRDKA